MIWIVFNSGVPSSGGAGEGFWTSFTNYQDFVNACEDGSLGIIWLLLEDGFDHPPVCISFGAYIEYINSLIYLGPTNDYYQVTGGFNSLIVELGTHDGTMFVPNKTIFEYEYGLEPMMDESVSVRYFVQS